jgi:hypothetical protein
MWGVEVGITPGRVKRWHDRHRAHTLPRDPGFSVATVLSVANAVHQVQRFKDAIAQRSSPGLASNRANRQAQTDASVTIRPLILTPAQWVSQICTETDVLAADVLLYPRPSRRRIIIIAAVLSLVVLPLWAFARAPCGSRSAPS